MELQRIDFDYYLRARSVEGHGWQKSYSSSLDVLNVAQRLGMHLPADAQLLLERGTRMPGYPKGFSDYSVNVTDSQLAEGGLQMVGEWRAGR